MPAYRDIYYQSADGLRLYARDYEKPDAPLTVLCMHGLTRNSADFEGLADRLNAKYRVISVDQRGRGGSACDPDPTNYNPITYVGDMFTLLDHLKLDKVVAIGTSMGGVIAMIMCATQSERISGLVLNDIGPVIDQAGMARIKSYAGKTKPVTSWQDAVDQVREINESAFPDYGPADWRRFARRTYREDASGVPVPNYDLAIATSLDNDQDNAAPTELWNVFESTKGLPLLVLRGEHSDILSADTADEMRARHNACSLVTVPNRGHAPMLDERAAERAIDSFLAFLVS